MGARGPKPLPANIHILRGNSAKIPPSKMMIDGVMAKVEIPTCPSHLSPVAKKEWKRITPELETLGLIALTDRATLAAYCSAWADVVQSENEIAKLGTSGLVALTPTGYEEVGSWVTVREKAYARMAKFAAEFGMSPSARTRVTASKNRGEVAPAQDEWVSKGL